MKGRIKGSVLFNLDVIEVIFIAINFFIHLKIQENRRTIIRKNIRNINCLFSFAKRVRECENEKRSVYIYTSKERQKLT